MLKISNTTKDLYEKDSIKKNLNITVRETVKSSKINVFNGLIRGNYNYGLGTYNIYEMETRVVFPEPNLFPGMGLDKPDPPTGYSYIEPFVDKKPVPYYWIDDCKLILNNPDISLNRLLSTVQPIKDKKVKFILLSFKLEEDRTELFNIMDSNNISRDQHSRWLRFSLGIKLKSGITKALEAKEEYLYGGDILNCSEQITLTFNLSDIPEIEEIDEILDLRIGYRPTYLLFFSKFKNLKLPLTYKVSYMMINYIDMLSDNVENSYSLLSCYDTLNETEDYYYRIACKNEYTILDEKDLNNYINYWNPKLFITNNDLIAESFSLHESLCSTDNLKFGCCESSYCQFDYRGDLDLTNCELTINQEIYDENNSVVESVPLGIFYVTDTKKQYFGTQTQKHITAYDKLYTLQNNVSDWFSMYMWKLDLVNSAEVSKIGENKISYCRQVFSTYFSLAKHLGYEDLTNYNFTEITPDESISGSSYSNYLYEYFVPYKQKPINVSSDDIRACALNFFNRMRFNVFTTDSDGNRVYNYDPYKPFLIESKSKIVSNLTDIKNFAPEYLEQIDPICRVIYGVGSCLVEEHLDNGKINRFLVDLFDMFLLSPEVEYFILHFPATIKKNVYNGSYQLDSNLISVSVAKPVLYQADKQVYLINGSRRLMYYNYETRELFNSDSSIVARDVIQSLLEITGCFFKIDRYNNTQFKYCSRTALTPSLTLYPSEKLFPSGSDVNINANSFEYLRCEDYVIEKYGKIQIVKSGLNSSSNSCVEWTYIGNEKYLNTYIIEDNIFYCNNDMVYNPEIEDVKEMLIYMFNSIYNVTYTPMEVKLVGLPYIELGDLVTLITENDAIESFLFKRDLNGIQSLHDIFESSGSNYVPSYNNFGFKQINN